MDAHRVVGFCRLSVCLGLLLVLAGTALAEPPEQVKQAFTWASEGYRLWRGKQLEEAEAKLGQAGERLPGWWGPQAVLGALYQQRAYAAAQANDQTGASAWETKARAAYGLVYQAGFGATFSKAPTLPWVEAEQVVQPVRGLLGSSATDLFHLLLTAADTAPEGTVALPLAQPPQGPPVTDEASRQALIAASVELTWSLNDQRLAEGAPPLCPDAWLTVLARTYGLWLLQSETRGQKWREERFAKAFPEVSARLTNKEVMAWAEPQRGSVRPGLPREEAVEESLRRLLRATTHRQVLMDTTLEWLGCAVVPAGANAFILQFDLATQRP